MAIRRARTGTRTIHCYLCGHAFEVSGRTMSTTCPGCNKAIQVEDVVVKSYLPVNDLATCGRIQISRRGRIAAKTVRGGDGITVEGTVEGSIETQAGVSFGPKSHWKGGTLRSPSVEIKDGASLEGRIEVPFRKSDA